MSDTKLTIEQKKDWAKIIYTKEGVTVFKKIAERVGVQPRTISNWVEDGNWEKMRKNMVLTRSEQLSKMLSELEELNSYIASKPTGMRFADSKEADVRSKLTSDIKKLENEASIAETIDVCSNIIEWLAQHDTDRSKEISDTLDNYIKHMLK